VQRMRGEHGLLKYLAAALRGKTVQGKTVQEPQDLDAERVWASIEDAVGLAILSVVTYVVPRDITTSGDTAEKAGKGLRRFKLLAAHVVLDVNLTPWVIKLDPSPSLPLTALGSAKPGAPAPADRPQDSARRAATAGGGGDGAAQDAGMEGRGEGARERPSLPPPIEGADVVYDRHDSVHAYTNWLFEGDVHDVSKDLERLEAQQSRVSHLRSRQRRRRRYPAVPPPRSLRTLLASTGGGVSAGPSSPGASPLSPSSHLRVGYALLLLCPYSLSSPLSCPPPPPPPHTHTIYICIFVAETQPSSVAGLLCASASCVPLSLWLRLCGCERGRKKCSARSCCWWACARGAISWLHPPNLFVSELFFPRLRS
jgi:hypothetical protein